MAVSKERNQVARELSDAIDPIANAIMQEWGLKFAEIQGRGLEPKFDREIIKRINQEPKIKVKFIEFMAHVVDNYGKIWYEFTESQKEIITLKESKIFW